MRVRQFCDCDGNYYSCQLWGSLWLLTRSRYNKKDYTCKCWTCNLYSKETTDVISHTSCNRFIELFLTEPLDPLDRDQDYIEDQSVNPSIHQTEQRIYTTLRPAQSQSPRFTWMKKLDQFIAQFKNYVKFVYVLAYLSLLSMVCRTFLPDRLSLSPKTSKLSASLPTGWASNLSGSYTG